ncbi:MAG: hypothetical protein JRJ16_09205 [Deltaproteobacteria bacterium]|nr:hypothetical protein [Deltaproteobacteria bacterium]
MASLVKSSGSFLVRPYESRDFQALRDMYLSFSPRGMFQGMPPPDDDACLRWIQGLLETGENFLAWREGSVVGHGVILPDLDKKDAEYGLGLESVWLTVGAYNMRAARLYRKFSFRFLEEPGAGSERTMVLTL